MASRHTCQVQITRAILSRIHIILHIIAFLALYYYRFYHLFTTPNLSFSWALMTFSELLMGFLWTFSQSFRWRPVVRTVVGPEEIENHELPGLDVFIFTVDPKKEPVWEVMNSVVSAMALEYPVEKLAVYLSDDGGSSLTREAIKEAAKFAETWLPFCRKYNVKTRCADAFFSPFCDGERLGRNDEFKADELVVKSKFEAFKNFVEKGSEDSSKCAVRNDRAPTIEIIHEDKHNGESEVKMPLLVYVSREKRPGHAHNAKAGAANTLLRVSGLLSNNPIILVLDCDMYCNDPTSALQAMCFHLDPEIAPSLAFVQFPQIFHNATKDDIYDGQSRSAFKTKYQGMDGQRGPVMSGTGYFLKRKALYGKPHNEDELLNQQPQKAFGSSSTFIASLSESSQKIVKESTRDELMKEAHRLATCAYESNTLWGTEVGYSYFSVLESTFSGYLLHCKGWKSVYLYPKKPCFLGCASVDMNDAMFQIMKWTSGLLQIGISKFSPLTYAMSRISILQSLCYAYFDFSALFCIPLLIYGIVLPYCLWQGIPVFPKVGDPWIMLFMGKYASLTLQHVYEVLSSGGTLKLWWNETRIWFIKGISGSLFGTFDALMNKIGLLNAGFRVTNKSFEKGKVDSYEKGKFDFRGAAMFMIPLTILVVLNLLGFLGGLRRVIIHKNYDEMFAQLTLSFYLLALSYPILEGIVTKGRKG